MLNIRHINKDAVVGICILALVFLACALPLTLSFLPQLLGMICLPYIWKNKTLHFSSLSKNHILWLGSLPLLGLISIAWSIVPEQSFSRAIKVIGLTVSYAPFLFLIASLSVAAKDYIKRFFYLPLIGAGAYLAIELMCGLPLMHLFSKNGEDLHGWLLNKNVAVFVVLFPLGLLSLFHSKHKFLYAFLILPLILILMSTDSQASWLAIIAMIIAGLTIYCSSVFMKLLWAGVVVVLSAMPFLAPILYHHFAVPMAGTVLGQASFSSRLEIWYFVSKKIMEQPLFGFGLDTTRYMTFDNPGLYHQGNTVMHPHNAALQIWNDFGVFGVVVVAASLAVLWRSILQTEKLFQVLCGVMISGLSVFLLVSWSLWASWLLGMIFFAAIITPVFLKNESAAS